MERVVAIFLILVMALLVFAPSAFGVWVEIPLPSDDTDLLRAAGDGSLWHSDSDDLYRTTDQGGTWQSVSGSTWNQIYTLVEKPSGTVIVLHKNPIPYSPPPDPRSYADETSDGGSTWTLLPGFTRSTFNARSGIAPTDSLIFIGGYGQFQPDSPEEKAAVLRSTDAGLTWSMILVGDSEDTSISSMSASQNGAIFASNFFEGATYRSLDNGDTWTMMEKHVRAIQVFAASDGKVYSIYLRHVDYILRISSDDGATWSDVTLPVDCVESHSGLYSVGSIAEDTNGTIWLGCSDPANVYTTIDSGTTWTYIGEVAELYDANIITGGDGNVYTYGYNRTDDKASTYMRLFRLTCLNGCFADGVCYSEGDLNPINSCLFCDSISNPSGWSDNDGFGCDDGIDCTETDSCLSGECGGTPNNALCDDSLNCNGSETCDAVSGCLAGTPIYCPDNDLFCDGNEYCDETADDCSHSGNPCGASDCDEENDDCVSADDDDDDNDDNDDNDDDDDDTADDDDNDDDTLGDESGSEESSGGCGC